MSSKKILKKKKVTHPNGMSYWIVLEERDGQKDVRGYFEDHNIDSTGGTYEGSCDDFDEVVERYRENGKAAKKEKGKNQKSSGDSDDNSCCCKVLCFPCKMFVWILQIMICLASLGIIDIRTKD